MHGQSARHPPAEPEEGAYRRRFSGRERQIAALATRQHGVVARTQLLEAGLSRGAIQGRITNGRLHVLHRGVYAYGHKRLSQRGHWLAAVFAYGDGALLSHRSAAALWGVLSARRFPIELLSNKGRSKDGITVHRGKVAPEDRAEVGGIPVTSVARTLFDLAEVIDERALRRAFEEADRLGLVELSALEAVCSRGHGRRAVRPIRQLIREASMPEPTRSPLEDRFLAFCRESRLPPPQTNVSILGREVDAYWPRHRLAVEVDGWSFHGHRAAFERDRARDAAMQAAGYRVVRVTYLRLEREPAELAAELRRLLGEPETAQELGQPAQLAARDVRRPAPLAERGQSTVEWLGVLLIVALLLAGVLAAGARVPGTDLAEAVASRVLCAAALADSCRDEPALIAVYGTEVGQLVRRHMPAMLFENDARALPVNFRRCRSIACGDETDRGRVHRTDAGLPVTAFVHVVDCRPPAAAESESEGADCSGSRAGNLYIQYWTYYANSASFRGVPLLASAGYHDDDWESVEIRISPDGSADERASSHHGYNHSKSMTNWVSDAGIGPLRGLEEDVGLRESNGWGDETHRLLVSGGSHAGNAAGHFDSDRRTPGRDVHLIPLDPVTGQTQGYEFEIVPPWRKHVWFDPEADGTE